MAEGLLADVSLQAATGDDIPFLSALAGAPEVAPFLMTGAGDAERLRAFLANGHCEGVTGLFVIRSPDAERLGGLVLQLVNRRSGICELSRLMVRPERRRAGIAATAVLLACRRTLVDQGLHRIQAEVYGDNLPAQALFERVGFTREGTRRRAYWRRGSWLDGVLFGMLAEELPPQLLRGLGPGPPDREK